MRELWVAGFILSISLSAAATASAATRVALVTDRTSDISKRIEALSIVGLSDENSIQLLEREQVDRVLEEQKLSLSGLLSSEQALRTGQLLKADLFAVLQPPGKDDAASVVGLVVFDVDSGLRLCDVAIDAADVEAAAARVAAEATAAAAKGRTLGKDVRPICFLPVRNADLPPDMDSRCQAVGLMLERKLLGSSGVAVLERSRLEHVNRERRLPTTSPAGPLWTSMVTIQVDVGRGTNGKGLRAVASARIGGGERLGPIEHSIDDESVGLLAEKLAGPTLEMLAAKPAGNSFDTSAEAARFAAEGQLLLDNGRLLDALAAAESSVALEPSARNTLLLAPMLMTRAYQIVAPDNLRYFIGHGYLPERMDPVDIGDDALRDALGVAERGLTYYSNGVRSILADLPSDEQLFQRAIRRSFLVSFTLAAREVKPADPLLRARLQEFRSRACADELDCVEAWARAAERDAFSNLEVPFTFYAQPDLLLNCAASLEEYHRLRDEVVTRWLRVLAAKIHKDPEYGIFPLGSALKLVITGPLVDYVPNRWTDFRQRHAIGLRPIADLLRKHEHPVMRLYGMTAEMSALSTEKRWSPNQLDRWFDDVLAELTRTLDAIPSERSLLKESAYQAVIDAVEIGWDNPPAQNRPALRMLELMAQRRDAISKSLLHDLRQMLVVDHTDSDLARRSAAVISRLLEPARGSDAATQPARSNEVRDALLEIIADYDRARPELKLNLVQRPWKAAEKLADASALGSGAKFEAVFIADEQAFFASRGRNATALYRVDLATREKGDLGAIPDWRPRAEKVQRDIQFPDRAVQGICADESNVYVSIRHQGIAVFPLDGKQPWTIDSTSGLPADDVQPIACLDGKLYAGLSGETAYLVAYDPRTRKSEILVSSLRREQKTPLDNTPQLCFMHLIPDPQSDRLILSVCADVPYYEKLDWEIYRSGLWAFSVNRREWKQLLTFAWSDAFEPIGFTDDHLYLMHYLCTIDFDLKRDVGSFIRGSGKETYVKEISPAPAESAWSAETVNYWRGSTKRVVDGWLWRGQPFSRTSRDSKTVEMLDPKILLEEQALDNVRFIMPAPRHGVVVGDERRIYLLKMQQE